MRIKHPYTNFTNYTNYFFHSCISFLINTLHRNRLIYLILIILTVAAGIVSRKFSSSLPSFIAEYAGDTLWALSVYFVIIFIFNKIKPLTAAIAALAFSYLIELSQLYQSDWINAIRNTTIGALVLGFGFLWSDIACYTIGVTFGFALDKLVNKNTRGVNN